MILSSDQFLIKTKLISIMKIKSLSIEIWKTFLFFFQEIKGVKNLTQ